MESKEKEGKLNEAEKEESNLKLGSNQKWKEGGLKVKHCDVTHIALVLLSGHSGDEWCKENYP